MTQDVTRRTVVKGAAWAVPVIAVAATVPAAAASEPACVFFYGTSVVSRTTTTMTIRFSYDLNVANPVAAGTILRIWGITGQSFTGINGNTTFPQDHPVTAANFDLTLTRSGDVQESGLVVVNAETLAADGTACGGTANHRFAYVYPRA